ncbi:MAG TPA: hypothetical protein VLT91_13830 [Rhizomicrobium sp.]|nr:hypothetical protein [Rhizomicrobium sp.]
MAHRSGRPYIKFRERNNPCCGAIADAHSGKDADIARHTLRFGQHTVTLPSSKPLRIALGIAFILGGMFAILPVLGIWMIPVGVFILSIDFAPVRRLRRRTVAWYGRSWLRRAIGGLSQRWGRASDKKKGPSGELGPKALGNGGVSSREDDQRLPQ